MTLPRSRRARSSGNSARSDTLKFHARAEESLMDIGDAGDSTLEMLFEAARRAARRAYAPYSNFRVGSALRLKDGTIVTGVNVENASYGMTICGERSALVRAITEHGPGIRVWPLRLRI